MMAGVSSVCEECEGRRYQAAVLELRLGGRDISEVLSMSAAEAREFFSGVRRPHRRRSGSSTGSSTSDSDTSPWGSR